MRGKAGSEPPSFCAGPRPVPASVAQERVVQDRGPENIVLQDDAPRVMATEAAARQELFAKGLRHPHLAPD